MVIDTVGDKVDTRGVRFNAVVAKCKADRDVLYRNALLKRIVLAEFV